MPKAKTKVINETGSAVVLKMSAGGILSKLSTGPVEDKAYYSISVDMNATYREYWCAVQPGTPDDVVILSSDDCAEYSEVKLIAKNVLDPLTGNLVPRYEWLGTKYRDSTRAPPRAPVNVDAAGQTPAVIANATDQAGSSHSQAPLNANGAQTPSSPKARSHCTIS